MKKVGTRKASLSPWRREWEAMADVAPPTAS